MAKDLAVLKKTIQKVESKFDKSVLVHDVEMTYAIGQLTRNDAAYGAAVNNPTSLALAMGNVAGIGLSLNPAMDHAYLVPRGGAIHLDISYRGLMNIAVKDGAITACKAELVYQKDLEDGEFMWNGPFEAPTHRFNPFETDRGEVVGGYVITKLAAGGVLADYMSRADMDKIRGKAATNSPAWRDFSDQMQLKVMVKRASKWWPLTSERMGLAQRLLNEENGEGLASLRVVPASNEALVVEEALPPPPSENQLDASLVSEIRMYVARVVDKGLIEQGEELFRHRYSTDPSVLSFALNELKEAQVSEEREPIEAEVTVIETETNEEAITG